MDESQKLRRPESICSVGDIKGDMR